MSTFAPRTAISPRPPAACFMTATTLQGDKVVNHRDEFLGTVRDITIEIPSGRIAYVVMADGGMFGVADQLFAVPWLALTLDPVRKCFVMGLALDKLDQVPVLGSRHGADQVAGAQRADSLHLASGA